MANRAFLWANKSLYHAVRPLLFRGSAQRSHEQMIEMLRWLDDQAWAQPLLRQANQWAFEACPVTVGGVTLPHPLILAAGFVKGDGFASETEAVAAVERGRNIIPGWRSMPALVGSVEFGSFTRWPRTGNPGTVLWRDVATQSTQNRVGLRNPGAKAAASFLAQYRDALPAVYGLNIAVSPGVDDLSQQVVEVLDSITFFTTKNIRPNWFTLNLSCPNTEDDPGGNQTETQTRALCEAVTRQLDSPLWVKVSPDLADEQYRILMRVFAETGVAAVIATNTLGQPAPDNETLVAGVGGGRLHHQAVAAVTKLLHEKSHSGYTTVDVIGCGGIMDRATFHAFGTSAAQYWSALVYRGPLAAAFILNEERDARQTDR